MMKPIENFKISMRELGANKLRTALTMLGIIFGVGAVIAMLSIGEGARQETLEQIKLLGTNNIIINTKAVEQNIGSKNASFSPGLNINDSKSIQELNPYVESITPQREGSARIMYKSKLGRIKLIGTTPNYPQTYNSRILSGKFFAQNHIANYSNVCVIGAGIKDEYFRFEDPIGKSVKLNGDWFTVIGVMSRKNISASGMENLGMRDFNNDIYIPFSTMVNKISAASEENGDGFIVFWGQEEKVNVIDRKSINKITAKIADESKMKEAAALTEKILARKHYGVKDYEVIIPEQLLAQKQKTQKIFNIVMGAIAGISLLVGGIGIMNIMLANILERTREIGIRRAVGATRTDVLNQFIYEAMIISILGGLLGIVVGFVITSLITSYAEWRTIITPYSVILSFIVSVCVGLVFGIYPAKKAADKDPIESLRYE